MVIQAQRHVFSMVLRWGLLLSWEWLKLQPGYHQVASHFREMIMILNILHGLDGLVVALQAATVNHKIDRCSNHKIGQIESFTFLSDGGSWEMSIMSTQIAPSHSNRKSWGYMDICHMSISFSTFQHIPTCFHEVRHCTAPTFHFNTPHV